MKGYIVRLKQHDWFYMLNNSNMLYQKGKKAEERLLAIAEQKGGHRRALFDAMVAWREQCIAQQRRVPVPSLETIYETLKGTEHADRTDLSGHGYLSGPCLGSV